MSLVFIKADAADTIERDLLPERVPIKGHVRGPRYILPHHATRHKAIEPAPNQPAILDPEEG